MNTARLVLAALVVTSGTVYAELVEVSLKRSSSVFSHVRLYGHVETPSPQSWAERQLSLLRRGSEKPFRIAALKRPQRTDAGQTPDESPESPVTSPLTWDSGDRGSDGGIGLGRAVGEAAREADLGEMPKIATGVADALKMFSDSTVQLVFSLRRLMSQMRVIDVGKLVRKKARQASRHASSAKLSEERRANAQAKAALEREVAKRTIKRVVRSAFRIVIGICVGVFLWVIVRGSFR